MLVLQRPVLPPRLPQRPRVVGEEILLGKNTRLARLVAVRGFWEIEDWPEDALRALLAQAYGPSEAVLQPLVKAVRAATTLLPRSLIQAANALQGLPEPQADADSRLTQAERLLKAGANPQTLATAMRREGVNLRPAPAWSERLALCDKGVVLGHGTVIVDLTDQPDGSTGLAVEGNEANILALLSVASGRLVSPDALNKLASASRSLAKGNVAQAAIALCHIGQPSLQDRDLAKMLTVAASCLGRGHRPGDVMKACGFTSTQLRKGGPAQWNPEDHPRGGNSQNTGQFSGKNGEEGVSSKKKLQMKNDEKFPYDVLQLADGTEVKSPFGAGASSIEIPQNVSLNENAQYGQSLRDLPLKERMVIMLSLFKPGGSMDYQSIYSVDPEHYNLRYISIGNFNYGVVMAAAGFTLYEAKEFAAVLNSFTGGEKEHRFWGGNPKNETMIEAGYNEYAHGNLPIKDGERPMPMSYPIVTNMERLRVNDSDNRYQGD